MRVHWREIVLAREDESGGAIPHERESLAFSRVHGIERLDPDGLPADVFRQVNHAHGAHVDNALAAEIGEIVFLVHLPLLSTAADIDGLDDRVGNGALQVHMQQPVHQPGTRNLDTFGKHEGALELAGRDAAMQEYPLRSVIGLTAADNQLPVLEGDREILFREAGNSQRYAEGVLARLFNVVGRISVIAGLGCTLDKPFKLIEAEQERMRSQGDFRHVRALLAKRLGVEGPIRQPFDRNMGCRFPCGKCFPRGLRGTIFRRSATDAGPMNKIEQLDHLDILRVKLEVLRREHRDLDDAIAALDEGGRADPLTLRRLKKQKLMLKDRIARIEDELTPDIIA